MRASLLLSTITLLAFAAVGGAQQANVTASDGWVSAPAPGTSSASAFVAIENPTMYDVYVVSAASPAAAAVEFRDASTPGESKLVKELTVPAYGSLTLTPGGPHLVLKDLKAPLKAGESVDVSLTTDGNITVKVIAVVK